MSLHFTALNFFTDWRC